MAVVVKRHLILDPLWFLNSSGGFFETLGTLLQPVESFFKALGEIAERFEEAAERVQGPQRDEDKVSFDDYRQLIEVRTKEVETLLTAIMRASKELRKLRFAAASEIDDGTPIH